MSEIKRALKRGTREQHAEVAVLSQRKFVEGKAIACVKGVSNIEYARENTEIISSGHTNLM